MTAATASSVPTANPSAVHEEGPLSRKVTRGPLLYWYSVAPAALATPRAVVGLLHGYADHGKRYQHVADAWADRGIATIAIDMRGHGRSEGKRGYCERFDEFLDDSAELTRLVQERAPGVPAFLFGHSFGGLVASATVLAQPSPWRGLVLTSPYFGMALDVPAAKLLVGKLASRIVPALSLPSGMGGAQMTHDPARVQAYENDPLIFKTVTARWFTEAAAAQDATLARAASLALPLYVVASGADPVAKFARTRQFFDAAGSADKKFQERPGLFHEVLNEPEWPSLAGGIADFIASH
jgi:alpha-beta hydrolase superfamily lysophospholipase